MMMRLTVLVLVLALWAACTAYRPWSDSWCECVWEAKADTLDNWCW